MNPKKLAKVPSAILEQEMLRRAIIRTQADIHRAHQALISLEQKRLGQVLEFSRQQLRNS